MTPPPLATTTPESPETPQLASESDRNAATDTRPFVKLDIDSTEMRDFSRTVAEIEWLLVILVLLFHVFQDGNEDNTVAIYAGLIAFSALIIAFHYLNFLYKPGRWSLAIETWLMIVFITYVLLFTGRLHSPLLNLFLLPIVTSALTLGQKVTLLNVGLVAACYLFLGYSTDVTFLSIITAGNFAADLAPMLTSWVVDDRLALRASRVHDPGLLNPADPGFQPSHPPSACIDPSSSCSSPLP